MGRHFIYDKNSSIIVNREWLRLYYTLLKNSDNSIFWLKTDCNKSFLDSANNTDVIIKYKSDKDILRGKYLEKNTKENNLKGNMDDIILLPFHKVNQFNKMGIIMFSSHYYLIPKILHLGNSFTIFFRFYFPTIDTDFEHCLIQDSNGKTILGLSKDCVNLISYSKDGQKIDSGVLLDQSFKRRWLSAGLTYKEQDNQTSLSYFFENEIKRSYDKGENYKLPNNIAFIGNSKDFNNPFGVFCDLRIYPFAVDVFGYLKIKKLTEEDKLGSILGDKQYSIIFKNINQEINKNIIDNFLDFNNWGNPLKCNDFDNTEESFYFLIKILNCLLTEKEARKNYIKYELTFKIMEFLKSKSLEIRKEISKFLNNLS